MPWDSLEEDQVERLIFDLVNTSRGYRNAQWLTHTNAPDDGRDHAGLDDAEDLRAEPV